MPGADMTPEESILDMRRSFMAEGWPMREADLRACILSLTSAISSLANVAEGDLRPEDRARQIESAKRHATAATLLALGIMPHGS